MTPRKIRNLGFLYTLAILTATITGPVFAQNNLDGLCSEPDDLQSLYRQDWEAGLGPWTADRYDIGNPNTFDTPDWSTPDGLPGGRIGRAAFVPNLNIGDCATDDESGVLSLESPDIALPVGTYVPRVALEHWFDIEPQWDGGNIRISVNGGAFTLVPQNAFEANGYNDTLFEPTDEFGVLLNLNPLAGQPAFTAISGGDPAAWVQSEINLSGIAEPGDTVRLRIDFGIDDCNGSVGWYVDDVEVYSCASEASVVCGDGLVEGVEQCDDGDTSDGDGCSASCTVEDGWTCDDASPSQCTEVVLETRLTLRKVVVNTNGGTAAASDWTLTASGPTGFSGRGPTVQSPVGFEPGNYDLSEAGDVAGYAASAWSCEGASMIESNSVAIAVGGTVTCTVTNSDIAPSLTLVKEVVNDDGGTAAPSDWLLTATGPTGFSGPGPSVQSGTEFRAGTYSLSESGGPGGYVEGAWACSGGNQIDGHTLAIAIGETATCVVTNDDFDPDAAINVGHNGAWYNPATGGQGLLLDIDPVTEYMFVAWFTFTPEDSAQPFEQRWLTAQGEYSGNQAELVLYETLGGEFNQPITVETLPIGTLTLVFGGCEDGYASYRIDDEGIEGEFPLIRAIPGSGSVCQDLVSEASAETDFATQSIGINSGLDGAWYDRDTSGQGFLIDANPDPVNGNFLFIAWFTFGDTNASGQWWLTVQGAYDVTPAEVTIYETTGGSFDDPRTVETSPVGEMQVDFIDCNNATLTFDIPGRGLQDQVTVTRVLPGTEELCEQIVGAD